ncbi:hypothetical protein P9112_011164 [Eukaryota sp. TZLM1-RC]
MGLTRGDLAVPSVNGSLKGRILDAMSIDPCNSFDHHFLNSAVNQTLLAGENTKEKIIFCDYENSLVQFNLCFFVVSLLGFLGNVALAFFEDFSVVKEKTERIFNRVHWQKRLVFSNFKRKSEINFCLTVSFW